MESVVVSNRPISKLFPIDQDDSDLFRDPYSSDSPIRSYRSSRGACLH